MTLRVHARPGACRPAAVAVLTAMALVLTLAGCGDRKKDKDKAASQTAAKVNKEEITVHQINFVLQQQRGLAPERAASAAGQVLERLIDQELAVQKAQDQKFDRDARVIQQIEAARREIIARAYVEKIAAGAPKPSPAEVKAYYDTHPALFKERRIYNLQELNIQASPQQVATLQTQLAASKNLADFIAYLKANEFKFGANQMTRAAEQLPLANLDKFAGMKDGESIFAAVRTGAQVVTLAGSRSQPVDEAAATAAIEQFLLNERKRKVVEDDLKALRAASKIEYVGDYAKGGARDAASALPAVPDAQPLSSVPSPLQSGSMPSAAPQVEVEPISAAPASVPSPATLDKGMKGLK